MEDKRIILASFHLLEHSQYVDNTIYFVSSYLILFPYVDDPSSIS